MSIYERAYAGCKGNKNKQGDCQAIIKTSDADMGAFDDIEGAGEQLQAVLDEAAAGCMRGCNCKSGSAVSLGKQGILVNASDPTQGKPGTWFPKKLI